MKSKRISFAAAIAAATGCLFLSTPAGATALTIVDVGAPAVNCIFHTSCTVVVTDSVGNFPLPGDAGDARLQSRTYPGTAPAPAAGDMAYVYRMDLTDVKGLTAVNCVSKFIIPFGQVVPLPYSPKGTFDVFVVTSGGLGTVGLSSAIQAGTSIEFTFAHPVCPGETSYFFGLASRSNVPKPAKADVFRTLGGSLAVPVRVP